MREALLGRQFHGVMFDYTTLDFLLERFLNHDFNVASFRRGLQVIYLTSIYILRLVPNLVVICFQIS